MKEDRSKRIKMEIGKKSQSIINCVRPFFVCIKEKGNKNN